MNIPQNGRIAIIDDQISQALPIMRLCGKRQLPYVYYDGDFRGLPELGEATNDIRLLFLDINLSGDAHQSPKDIKGNLIAVLNRVISEKNHPYLLAFWSRHEEEHGGILQDIFENVLTSKAPIDLLSLRKTDFFDLAGNTTDDFEENVASLFDRISQLVDKHPIYSHLMKWENIVHSSADFTLEEIFKLSEVGDNWDQKSNYLFFKLAQGFTGQNFNNIPPAEKIKSGYYTLNMVFHDSLEYSISSKILLDNPMLEKDKNYSDAQAIHRINRKLLFASEKDDKKSPGIISLSEVSVHNFGGLFTAAFLRHEYYREKKRSISGKLKIVAEKDREKVRKKIEKELFEKLKAEVKKKWIPIELNVTPICDFVQCKEEYSRILPGILIEIKYKRYINANTEALFISPNFSLNIPENKIEGDYFLLLDFRFFTSIPKSELIKRVKPILRTRQILLTEIQSKLSRHINRQGILFLE